MILLSAKQLFAEFIIRTYRQIVFDDSRVGRKAGSAQIAAVFVASLWRWHVLDRCIIRKSIERYGNASFVVGMIFG